MKRRIKLEYPRIHNAKGLSRLDINDIKPLTSFFINKTGELITGKCHAEISKQLINNYNYKRLLNMGMVRGYVDRTWGKDRKEYLVLMATRKISKKNPQQIKTLRTLDKYYGNPERNMFESKGYGTVFVPLKNIESFINYGRPSNPTKRIKVKNKKYK